MSRCVLQRPLDVEIGPADWVLTLGISPSACRATGDDAAERGDEAADDRCCRLVPGNGEQEAGWNDPDHREDNRAAIRSEPPREWSKRVEKSSSATVASTTTATETVAGIICQVRRWRRDDDCAGARSRGHRSLLCFPARVRRRSGVVTCFSRRPARCSRARTPPSSSARSAPSSPFALMKATKASRCAPAPECMALNEPLDRGVHQRPCWAPAEDLDVCHDAALCAASQFSLAASSIRLRWFAAGRAVERAVPPRPRTSTPRRSLAAACVPSGQPVSMGLCTGRLGARRRRTWSRPPRLRRRRGAAGVFRRRSESDRSHGRPERGSALA